MTDFDKLHRKGVESVQKRIKRIYEDITREIGKLDLSGVNPNTEFKLSQHPRIQRKVDQLSRELGERVERQITSSIEHSWRTSNQKNDQMVRNFIRNSTVANQYLNYNNSAVKQFIKRKDAGGVTLSDRIWRSSEQYKQNVEWSLAEGIADGKSAQQISQHIRQNLDHPDKLFRRVRDENGNLVLSRPAREYNPGRGIYRSSYQNAKRVAITETNNAYREADYERWQEMDFVVGIRISVSNTHWQWLKIWEEQNPGKVEICDGLSGEYPKDFKFSGWHPQCRCIATPILADQDEFMDAMMEDREIRPSNEVKDVPAHFKDWVGQNTDRIESAKSLPYFLRDNQKYVAPSLADGADPRQMKLFDDVLFQKASNEYEDRIDSLTTIRDIEIEFTKELKEVLGYDVRVSMHEADGISVETAKLYAKEFVALNKEYNLGQQKLAVFYTKPLRGLNGQVSQSVTKDKITKKKIYGNKHVNVRAKLKDGRFEDVASFFSRCDNDKKQISTLVHEFAHLVASIKGDMSNPNTIDFFKELRSVATDYLNEISSLSTDPVGLEKIFLGTYASTNINEFLAEAFQEYKNSRNPSKYAKLVGNLFDRHFRRR